MSHQLQSTTNNTMTNKAKTWNLINPKGEPVEITNLAKFCEDNSLHYHRVWNMLNNNGSVYGEVMCSGWKKDPNSHSPSRNIARDELQLKHDDGRFTSRTRYRNRIAKQAGISTSSVHRLITGASNSISGWRLTSEVEPGWEELLKGADLREYPVYDLEGEDDI